jgi:hypothetical protein
VYLTPRESRLADWLDGMVSIRVPIFGFRLTAVTNPLQQLQVFRGAQALEREHYTLPTVTSYYVVSAPLE